MPDIIVELMDRISKAIKEISEKIREAFRWLSDAFDIWKTPPESSSMSLKKHIYIERFTHYKQPFIKSQRLVRCRGNC